MKILHLTINKRWFDMIKSGEKREEYREYKPYWIKRLNGQDYDAVQFRNGYRPDSPTVLFELKGISVGTGLLAWGAPKHSVHILELGSNLTDREKQ